MKEMRKVISCSLLCLLCLQQVTGSKFLAPMIIRSPDVTHKVTLLSKRPTGVKVRQAGSSQYNQFNVAYSHPLQLDVPAATVDANRNFSQDYSSLELTSDGRSVAFLSSEGSNDLTVTSLISTNGDGTLFVIPYFLPNNGAALVVSGTGNFDVTLTRPGQGGEKIKGGRSATVRIVPKVDITGFIVSTARSPAAVYIDIPCLVSPHNAGVCGTAHVPVPPVARLGYDHVIPRPPGRPSLVSYRVTALTNTHVLIWDQTNEWTSVGSLQAGDFYDGGSYSDSISIKCDGPCSVTQVLTTNTTYNFKAIEVVPDLTKSRRTVIFELNTLPQGDVHYVTVLTLTIHQRTMLLNGIPLGGARWTMLSSWPEWSLASFPVPEGKHNISSTQGLAPILAWHYATFNNEVLTFGSITGFGCQEHLCMNRNEDGDCISCRDGLVLNSGKCKAPEVSAMVGGNVSLPCYFMTSQTTNIISWYKEEDVSQCGYEQQNSRKLVASLSSTGVKSVSYSRADLETFSGNLEINDIEISDEGSFTCWSYGSIMSRVEVKLSVYFLPEKMTTSWSVIGDKAEDFKLQLKCDVASVRPQPAHFYWLLPDGSQVGQSTFSDNPDDTIEAQVTYLIEPKANFDELKCVMILQEREIVETLPFDNGLRLLLGALRDPLETKATGKNQESPPVSDETKMNADETQSNSDETDTTRKGEGLNTGKQDESNFLKQNGWIIGAAIGGLVVILLVAVLIFLAMGARNFKSRDTAPRSPSLDSVGYCVRRCGCPQARINRADSIGTCSPMNLPARPSCTSDIISGSRRELLVCTDNDYDSCEMKPEEDIAMPTSSASTTKT